MSFEAFEAFILKSMVDHIYDPDDSVTLWNAFRVFDKENTGKIHVATMIVMGIENPNVFIDGEHFMYEKYINKLCKLDGYYYIVYSCTVYYKDEIFISVLL